MDQFLLGHSETKESQELFQHEAFGDVKVLKTICFGSYSDTHLLFMYKKKNRDAYFTTKNYIQMSPWINPQPFKHTARLKPLGVVNYGIYFSSV